MELTGTLAKAQREQVKTAIVEETTQMASHWLRLLSEYPGLARRLANVELEYGAERLSRIGETYTHPA